MLDQSLVRSGFDAEVLLGERQFSYVLLGLVDAGLIPTTLTVGGTVLTLLGPDQIDRTYEPHPDAPFGFALDALRPFEVEILFDHASGADLRVHAVLSFQDLPVQGDLFVGLTLDTTSDAAGGLESAVLKVEVLDLESDILGFVESQFGVDKATILAEIKNRVDRDLGLSTFGSFKRLQALAVRKLPAVDDHPRALGIYVNLRLQQSADEADLLPARGSVADAANFLPEGSDLAMASRADLFGDMATDAFARLAEVDEEGRVSHPWHKNIRDPKSKVIGKIKGISVQPLRVPQTGASLNMLRIDVHVEYQVDNFFDPDGHLVVNLKPSTNADGIMVWSIDADFHASLLLEILGLLVLASAFTGIGALVGLGLAAAIAAGLVAGALADFAAHAIVDELYSGRVEDKVDAGLPDVVSGRVDVSRRRWDPFYTTHHDVAMRPDGALVNDQGVALWGRAALARRVEPVPHVVVRDKLPASPTPPTHLRYRVRDAEALQGQFSAIAPGTDRRPFAQHDPAAEPTLYLLDLDQIVSRMDESRLVPDQATLAKRVDLRQNQVHSILSISRREQNEQRGALIASFKDQTRPELEAEHGEAFRQEVVDEFESRGETPTEEDIEQGVQERIDALLEEELDDYTEGALLADLERALLPLLRLEMPPENYAALQQRGILHLLELEIITMRSGLRYYRDHPDGAPADNLLNRPRFRATPDGPVLLDDG